MDERIDETWTALRGALAAYARALDDEVRSYPTPIARCDEQLTKAIADRDAAYRQLRRAEDLDRERDTLGQRQWRARLREFTRPDAPDESTTLAAARGRLADALGQ